MPHRCHFLCDALLNAGHLGRVQLRDLVVDLGSQQRERGLGLERRAVEHHERRAELAEIVKSQRPSILTI